MNNALRAISLWQPWGSAMLYGLKTNETRGRPTRVRGDVVICATKRKMDSVGQEIAERFYFPPLNLPYGCALCIVELFDCLPSSRFTMHPTVGNVSIVLNHAESDLGDYSPGRWVWRTRNLRALKTPVPVVGHQGFWFLPPEAATAIQAQL
jgi:activating signal cointegrator 1